MTKDLSEPRRISEVQQSLPVGISIIQDEGDLEFTTKQLAAGSERKYATTKPISLEPLGELSLYLGRPEIDYPEIRAYSIDEEGNVIEDSLDSFVKKDYWPATINFDGRSGKQDLYHFDFALTVGNSQALRSKTTWQSYEPPMLAAHFSRDDGAVFVLSIDPSFLKGIKISLETAVDKKPSGKDSVGLGDQN